MAAKHNLSLHGALKEPPLALAVVVDPQRVPAPRSGKVVFAVDGMDPPAARDHVGPGPLRGRPGVCRARSPVAFRDPRVRGEVCRAIEDPANGFLFQMRASVSEDGMWYEGENYHLFALRGLLTGLAWARALGEFGATILFAGSLPGRTGASRGFRRSGGMGWRGRK